MFPEGKWFVLRMVAAVRISTRLEYHQCPFRIARFYRHDQLPIQPLLPILAHQQARRDADNEQQSQEGEEEGTAFFHGLIFRPGLFEYLNDFFILQRLIGTSLRYIPYPFQNSASRFISHADICPMSQKK